MVQFRYARCLALLGVAAMLATLAAPTARADEPVQEIRVQKVVKDCDGEDCGEGEHRVIFIGEDGEVRRLEGHDFHWQGMPGDHHFVWSHHDKGGFLGVSVTDLTPELRRHFGVPEDSGVLVSRVVADSAAAAAGVLVGDILTAVDGEAVGSATDLVHRIRSHEPGETVNLEVWRGGAMETLGATLDEREARARQARKIMLRCGDDDEDCKGGVMAIGPDFDCGGAESCEVEITCSDGGCQCVVNGASTDCASLPGFRAPGD